MLSLAYRIATMKVFIVGKSSPEFLDAVREEIDQIKKSPKIRISNVAKYYREHEKSLWDIQDDVPNWSPPLHDFWLEWEMEIDGSTMQKGVHFGVMDVNDDNRSEFSGMFKVKKDNPDMEYPWGPPELSQQRFDDSMSKAKWILFGTYWISGTRCPFTAEGSKFNDQKILAGCPININTWIAIVVDEKGRCQNYYLGGDFSTRNHQQMTNDLIVCGLGISFMHCKNVKQVEAKEDPGERFRKQYKVPKFTYRTLCIDPMKEVLRREGQSETTGLKRALHICRGHFSTYSDEKPLFGKYAGTFWVSDHVRGKKEHGEVVKDYEVKSPAIMPGGSTIKM